MAWKPWIPTAEKIMIALVVLCVILIVAVVAFHLNVVPGCKASKVC